MTTAYASSTLLLAVVVVVVGAANVRIVGVPVVAAVFAALVDAVCRCGCRVALEWRANINKCVQND